MYLRPRCIFVLLAAGQGKRLGAKRPKQFLPLGGRPLIYWSLFNVIKAKNLIHRVVIAIPRGWNLKLLAGISALPLNFPWEPLVVTGGKTRSDSLRIALKALESEGSLQAESPLFVHDAARPLWPAGWIHGMLKALRNNVQAAGVIPVVAVRDTIKYITPPPLFGEPLPSAEEDSAVGGILSTSPKNAKRGGGVNGGMQTLPSRQALYASQTPQLVRAGEFTKALKEVGVQNFWDEAEVLERAQKILIPYPGDDRNIKITYKNDWRLLNKIFHANRLRF